MPAVTLAGIGGVIALGAPADPVHLQQVHQRPFAVTRALSLEFMIGVVVVGVLWYIGAYLVNRRRGIDLNLAYKEIPPE